jgi:alkyl sulfatase BDS1-like metallo-beta-lactamase superfamily hydrolase
LAAKARRSLLFVPLLASRPPAAGGFYPGSGILNVLIQSEPENIAARKLRIEILKEIGSQDDCLMSRNAWVCFINKDKEFFCSKGEL